VLHLAAGQYLFNSMKAVSFLPASNPPVKTQLGNSELPCFSKLDPVGGETQVFSPTLVTAVVTAHAECIGSVADLTLENMLSV